MWKGKAEGGKGRRVVMIRVKGVGRVVVGS